MTTLTTRARSQDPDTSEWVDQSPVSVVAGENIIYQLQWQGAASVGTTSELAYRLATDADVTSTVFSSGASAASGNVQTAKNFSAFTGGVEYVIVFQATVDGNIERRKLHVIAKRAQTVEFSGGGGHG